MALDGQALVPLNCLNTHMNGLNYEMEPQPGYSQHGVRGVSHICVSPNSIVFVPTTEKLLVSSKLGFCVNQPKSELGLVFKSCL
jgi:hypothetical protein